MSTPTTKITPSHKQKFERNWSIPVLLGVVILLLTSNLYTLILYSRTSKKDGEKVSKMKIDSLSLQSTYLSALDSLNQLRTQNEDLNIYVEEMKADLTTIYEEIGLKVKEGMSDYALKNELDRLKMQMRNSVERIANLQQNNNKLRVEVAKIKDEKNRESKQKELAIGQRDSLSEVVYSSESKLKNAIEEANAAKEKMTSKISELDSVISDASYIPIFGAKVLPQNQKRKKSAETEKAGKSDFYRICFTTSTNSLIAKGKQVFYVALLSEAGLPVQIGDEETKVNNRPVRYVRSFPVDYDGSSKEFCFNWEPTEKLKVGKYTLNIFHHNRKVGETTLVLK